MPYQSESLTRRLTGMLWLNWAVAFGGIAMELLLPRLISKMWLPLPVFFLAYLVLVYMRTRQRERTECTVMLRVSVLTLFWSALIMLIINILNSRMLLDNYIDWSHSNKDIPYITCLVVFPTMIIMCLWVMAGGYGRKTFVSPTDTTSEVGASGGVIDSLYEREGTYQVQLMLCIACGLSAVEWWYYFYYYINVNFNTPDVFFFNWMPISLYVFSLFFVWSRYSNIAAIIGPIASAARDKGVMVRYLVLSGDYMLLSLNEYDRWDTPAVTHVPAIDASSETALRKAFAAISDTEDFTLRHLYDTGLDQHPDVLHYSAFLPQEKFGNDSHVGSWFTIDQIDRLIKTAQLSADLTDEIYRIFTITMAWKTYDREGRRLYPIKHYRPTFRLRDLKDWDVDYSDTAWFNVARVNQDSPFYRTRRLWRKITGVRE